MANFIVDSNWIKYERAVVTVPKQLVVDLRQMLNGEMKAVKQRLVANVSGAILKRRTGTLAKSVFSKVRVFNSGTKVWSRAGSKNNIGRLWERGFDRRGKSYAKKWAEPVITPANSRISVLMEQTIQRTYDQGGL